MVHLSNQIIRSLFSMRARSKFVNYGEKGYGDYSSAASLYTPVCPLAENTALASK